MIHHVRFCFVRFFYAAVVFVSSAAGTAWSQTPFDHITHTVSGNTETWRITEPDVTVPVKAYPSIRFKKGDLVEVKAGGCVNIGPGGEMGKSTLTWRNYVYPRMDVGNPWITPAQCAKLGMSSQNYGTILIPGVTVGFKTIYEIASRITTLSGAPQYLEKKTWTVADPGVSDGLQLGYKDSRYTDNSYDNMIPDTCGYCSQCCDGVNAWVEIIITHLSPEINGTPGSCSANAPLSVNYKDIVFQNGMKMGLFGEKDKETPPKYGSKDIVGPAGTLTFNAPGSHGRYVFRIFDTTGRIHLSGTAFTVIASMGNEIPKTPDSAAGPAAASAALKPDVISRQDKIRPSKIIPPETSCENAIPFPPMKGYTIVECVKRFDETVIRLDEDPDAVGNPHYEGEKIHVKYEWTGDGPSPSELQIRRTYARSATGLGAAIDVDRNRYTAFTLNRSGRIAHGSVEIFNDGRIVIFTVTESETSETGR